MTTDKIHELTATQMLEQISSGALTSVALVEALEARIQALEPRLNCFVHREPDRVLAEARAADEARQRREVRGPLHGLPLTVKDNVDVAG